MSVKNKHTEWILETIDHLRKRKARPDLQRICHVVRRRHGLSAPDTEAKLERLVDAEIVIKVDYKGNTSYRNAAKWKRSMIGCAGVLNSTSLTTKILISIIAVSKENLISSKDNDIHEDLPKVKIESQEGAKMSHLDLDKPDVRNAVMRTGASYNSIEAWLQKNWNGYLCNVKSPLTVMLKREIEAGRIKKTDKGNYIITPEQMHTIHGDVIRPLRSKKTDPKHVDQLTSDSNDSASTSNANRKLLCHAGGVPSKRGRPPKLEKNDRMQISKLSTTTPPRIHTDDYGGADVPSKKMTLPKTHPSYHPDSASLMPKRIRQVDNTEVIPHKKIARKMATSSGTCDFCQRAQLLKNDGLPEILLCCKDCPAKAHPSCMEYSPQLAMRASATPWQCIDCKTCCLCEDPGRPEQMLFCDGCDKGYHMACHQPPILKKPSEMDKWECSACRLESAANQRYNFLTQHSLMQNFTADSTLPTPAHSPIPGMIGSFQHLGLDIIEGELPDASGWSVEDVAQNLASQGFSEDAINMFKEQEIDGVAMLLMKRTDVLKGLDLKLGPALKINRYIQSLQAVAHRASSQSHAAT